MGFLSFNLHFYKEKIEYYENTALTKRDVYEAKQLLKMIDDLIDEGHYELYNVLQKDLALADRLKAVIARGGEQPFAVEATDKSSNRFNADKIELTEYTDSLILRANACVHYSGFEFSAEIKRFCDRIGYDRNTAYIFLLRDALLPYLHFKNNGAENIYPYLISRSFLDMIYCGKNIDDIVRAVVFDALEKGHVDFKSYIDYCKKQISYRLYPFPKITAIIKSLLSEIKNERIAVIETGCHGTFPLLLCALDERVEFKMYTAAPYLFKTYKDRVFTSAYENMRSFETLYCQNSLFRLSDFKDNKFYVSENADTDVVEKSLSEIGCFLNQ